MKPEEYSKVIRETPIWVAMFKLNRIPEWLLRHVDVNEDSLFYYDPILGGIKLLNLDFRGKLKQGCSYGIGISYLKFVGYREIK